MAHKHSANDETRRKRRLKEINKKIANMEWQITLLTILSVIFLIIGVSLIVEGCKDFNSSETKISSRGDLGDYFSGTAGIAFSLSGLFLVSMSFVGQKQQLLFQEQEIIYQQEELEETRNAFVEQNKTTEQQRMENFFFQTLEFIHFCVQQIEWKGTQGKAAIEKLYQELNDNEIGEIECYKIIDNYIKTSFQLFTIIETDSNLKTREQKKHYFQFAAAQFSQTELDILEFMVNSESLKHFIPLKSQTAYKNFRDLGFRFE